MKKEDKKQAVTTAINYVRVVEEFSDEAFHFCREQLFPICNYRVLKVKDIRRIDLEERLLGFESIVPDKDELGKKQGSMNYYFGLVRRYMDQFIPSRKNSIADQYEHRAYDLMEKAACDGGCMEDAEDITLIFLVLFREVLKAEEDAGKGAERSDDRPEQKVSQKLGALKLDKNFLKLDTDQERLEISDISPALELEDAELIRQIWDMKELGPMELHGNAIDGLLNKVLLDEREKTTACELMYVDAMLFFCRIMDMQGAFISDEGEFDER